MEETSSYCLKVVSKGRALRNYQLGAVPRAYGGALFVSDVRSPFRQMFEKGKKKKDGILVCGNVLRTVGSYTSVS